MDDIIDRLTHQFCTTTLLGITAETKLSIRAVLASCIRTAKYRKPETQASEQCYLFTRAAYCLLVAANGMTYDCLPSDWSNPYAEMVWEAYQDAYDFCHAAK